MEKGKTQIYNLTSNLLEVRGVSWVSRIVFYLIYDKFHDFLGPITSILASIYNKFHDFFNDIVFLAHVTNYRCLTLRDPLRHFGKGKSQIYAFTSNSLWVKSVSWVSRIVFFNSWQISWFFGPHFTNYQYFTLNIRQISWFFQWHCFFGTCYQLSVFYPQGTFETL